jgi:polyisoprenyl-teichoic acid--peptidoglycan teichoic acid transferase
MAALEIMNRKRSRATRRWVRRALLGCLFLAMIASVWAFKVAQSFTSKGGGLTEVWAGISNPRGLFPSRDRVVILVVGKDYNHDSKGMPYTKDARADTIMLISADLEHQSFSTISVPRDTRVEDDRGVPHKINAMFQNGGVPLLKRTLLRELGIWPDYHIVLKDQAVRHIVDSVGGVEVEAIDDMFYEDSWGGLHIDLKKGRQRLSGDQAIGFVRFRKMGNHRIEEGRKIPITHRASLEEGDIRRTERQQQLVRALGSEALKPANLLRAESIVDTGFQQIETDLTRPQVLALATLFRGKSLGRAPSATLPGSDDMSGGVYYYVPNRERAQLTVQWLLKGDESAGRKLVRVVVLNGSDVKGAAREAAQSLEGEGYTVTVGGRQSDAPEQTAVEYRKAAQEPYARAIAQVLGAASVSKDTAPKGDWMPDIRVVIGKADGERFKGSS